MISNKEILLEKKLYEDLRKQYRKRSKRHPEGEISFKFQHGKHRPYINKNGEKKYLGMRDPLLVSMLLEKKLDNMMLKCIEETIQLLDRLQYEYRGEEWIFGEKTLRELETNIGKGFRLCDFMLKPGGNEDVAEDGGFRNNERIHVTPAGVVVRSKAELVIGTFLEMKGVDYVYERSMELEYRLVVPDFTIVRPSDGRMIIWEHFGMMDDREYYDNTINKLYDYQSSGWLPYENFIATFSKKNSAMNMTVIETIYNTMLK